MGIVFIRGLRINTVIGIYDLEPKITQPVVIDLDLASDNRKAAASEKTEGALNYKSISKRLTQ